MNWYRISDMRPPLRVHVPVQIMGREFIACIKRVEGRDYWLEYQSRQDDYSRLPKPIEDALSGGDGLWRPQNAATWQLPLPEPVTQIEAGRMTTTRQNFDAAEAAAEMEADRDAARAIKDDEPKARKRHLWWLAEGLAIKYDPPGSITRKDCEARLMRAVAADNLFAQLVGKGLHEAPLYQMLAADVGAAKAEEVCRALAESEAATPGEFNPRFEPLPADIADQMTAMEWFRALPGRKQVVLHLASRTVGYSWIEIGEKLAPKSNNANHRKTVSGDGAKHLYKEAIDEACEIANGKRTRVVDRIEGNIEAVRVGNRFRALDASSKTLPPESARVRPQSSNAGVLGSVAASRVDVIAELTAKLEAQWVAKEAKIEAEMREVERRRRLREERRV